jgi:O-antigen/teichoic acid export membrane protein
MSTYGGTTLIIIVSARLRFKSDSVIIGTFLSAAAITYFNIGARIVDYAGEVVENLAQVFMPMSSHSDAQGNLDKLRKIFVAGNRLCALTTFPICVMLVVLGKSVIRVWVGSKYVAECYPIMLILLLSTALMLAQAASPRVLFGMNKHRTWALVTLIEGLINIGLSIALVRHYGIMGDALGTALPLAATTIFFLPQHLCKLLQISVLKYLREAYILPLALSVPVLATLLLLKQWFEPKSYFGLLLQLCVSGAVYALGLFWAYKSGRVMQVRLQGSSIAEPAGAPVEIL